MRNRELCLLFAVTCYGQTTDTATIRGLVLDPSKAAVSGAHVRITNRLTQFERTANTGTTGQFSMAALPAGSYQVTAAKAAFADAKIESITLAGGSSADLNLELSLPGGQTLVTVTGVDGAIRTDQPQLGNRIDAAQAQSTPLLNRRITYLPLLSAANRPAINQGDVFINQNLFTTNGAGRRQTWFEVDGSSANDSWGRQTIFSTIPLAAVAEMTILENGFSAEFGGTGSALNIVTRGGGDRFHGELLGLWRPNATSASLAGYNATNATSGNQITSDSLGQGAASISGPLGGDSNRTHFFVSGEYTRQDRGSPVTSPLAPGIYVGHYRGWLGFLRIDHSLNEHNTLFLRSNLDGFHDTNPNGTVGGNSLPTVARVFRRRTYSVELGETAVITSTLMNSVRLQFQLGSPITQFDPVVYGTQYLVPISTGGTFTSGTSQSALLQVRQYQISDTLSTVRGRHQIKAGASVVLAHSGGNSKEFGGPNYFGQFLYNACTQPLSVCQSQSYLGNLANVRSYTQSYGNATYTVNDTLWALFLQDDYHMRRDLTVNLGLRYEQQTFTDSRKNFGPRAGFAYNFRGDGKTVMRGGFGIYYSQIINNAQANWTLNGIGGVFNYTAAPGQIGFPASVASVPVPAFPAGAQTPLRSLYIRPGQASELSQYFPTSTLLNYQDKLLNPYSEQWTFGVEHQLRPDWILRVDYIGSHTLKVNRPLDVNPPTSLARSAPGQVRSAQAANCTRPYWVWWYAQNNSTCSSTAASNPQPPYALIQSDVNNGYAYYDALNVNLNRRFTKRLSMLASYTWSHAINNVDPDIPGQNPNDARQAGQVENGSAIFDQRQRFVLSGTYVALRNIRMGGVATLASALPFNYTTGSNNSGSGATADRPVIDGVVVGRNLGRGRPIYDVAPFIERPFPFGDRWHIDLRAEAFNVLNHPNFVGYSGTYGNGATAGAGFGQPLFGVTNQAPARSLQFSAKLVF